MAFELFDPAAEVRIAYGRLPHWYQSGVTYFITFRTDDSFPAAAAKDWHDSRDGWLREHGIDPRLPDWMTQLRTLDPNLQRRFHAMYTAEFLSRLDKGHGACVLRQPALARVVADSFHHFDGDRYHLSDYVVMPNHVHLLVCLLGDTVLEEQCYSWKKFTAGVINKTLGRKGRFWHEESFDHLVRSPDQFDALRKYIADNPAKAHLRRGEYLHWRRETEE